MNPLIEIHFLISEVNYIKPLFNFVSKKRILKKDSKSQMKAQGFLQERRDPSLKIYYTLI
jgi:hypothetical protein